MTSRGHFLINGVPRVVVHQLVRRPGVYYHQQIHKITQRAKAQIYRTYYVDIIVHRGAWLRFEIDKKQQLWACARRITKTPIFCFFQAIGISRKRVPEIWTRQINKNSKTAVIDSATEYLKKKFFKGTLNQSGREQLNGRLGVLETQDYFTALDFLQIARALLEFARRGHQSDDVDHLNQKSVRAVGELLLEPIERGIHRFGHLIINTTNQPTSKLIHPTAHPITGAVREFFLTHPLSQFMDETNPLSELTHKRRISALGPGGVRRDSAGMSVRGIHPTYYGRICPIETPEGQNAGLVNSLATWSSVTRFGVMTAPFQSLFKAQVQHQRPPQFLTASLEEIGSMIMPDNPRSKLGFLPAHSLVARHEKTIQKILPSHLNWVGLTSLSILSIATSLIPFLEHDDANRALMGSNMQRQAVPLIINQKAYVQTQLEPRVIGNSQAGCQSSKAGVILYVSKNYLDIYTSSLDCISKTVLMGSSTVQKQLRYSIQMHVPGHWFQLNCFLSSNLNRISTLTHPGFQKISNVWRIDQTQPIYQPKIKFLKLKRNKSYLYRLEFQHFERSNQGTLINQKPIRQVFEWLQFGDLIADAATSSLGVLSLGRELWIGYMPWEGYNFEDAVLINNRLVNDDVFTSLHIERLTIHIREVQHGFERLTNECPGISSLDRLRLDSNGIVQLGTWVQEGDVLVGKMTPIQPRSLYPHERLLYDIVGQSTECVKDSSLRVPRGVRGRVIRLTVSNLLSPGESAPEWIQVYIAQKRVIQVGDKVAGRHGNKGVISKILPSQDMPYLLSGQIIDVVLNPLGVPSRMNVGQLFECMLGLAGNMLDEQFTLIPFDKGHGFEASRSFVYSKLLQARQKTQQRIWLSERSPGKTVVLDGRTGQKYIQPITIGCTYILKLIHLVDEKIHARSTGPYSLITQQPLRGRSKHGGQRLGEMEVWALEGFGAAYTLQELLTVKSDDARGRNQVMETILKNTPVHRGTPESFKVLLRELQALCLNIKICQRVFWT